MQTEINSECRRCKPFRAGACPGAAETCVHWDPVELDLYGDPAGDGRRSPGANDRGVALVLLCLCLMTGAAARLRQVATRSALGATPQGEPAGRATMSAAPAAAWDLASRSRAEGGQGAAEPDRELQAKNDRPMGRVEAVGPGLSSFPQADRRRLDSCSASLLRRSSFGCEGWKRYAEQRRIERLLDAIWAVETSRGRDLRPGDGGLAAGQLGQHEGHWRRGCEYLGVRWPWPQATGDLENCRIVAIANWRRDAPAALAAGDLEYLARTFRLPNDPYRRCNDDYWGRVRQAMDTAAITTTTEADLGRRETTPAFSPPRADLIAERTPRWVNARSLHDSQGELRAVQRP